MNRKSLILLISFISLLFFQIFVFNNMNIFGFINPMIYLVFLVIYDFDSDQTLFILVCFLLGFSTDFFSDQNLAFDERPGINYILMYKKNHGSVHFDNLISNKTKMKLKLTPLTFLFYLKVRYFQKTRQILFLPF